MKQKILTIASISVLGCAAVTVGTAALLHAHHGASDELITAAVDIPVETDPALDPASPERMRELNLPESAVYNPDRDEYYDSDYQYWDAENQCYVHIEPPAQSAEQPDMLPAYTGQVPAELAEAFAAYDACVAAYREEQMNEPGFAFRSDWCLPEDPAPYQTLYSYMDKYSDEVYALATTSNPYTFYAQMMVDSTLSVPIGYDDSANYLTKLENAERK